MSLPFFYVEFLIEKKILLNEDTSKHIITVLRMEKGDKILLTDGKGKKATASIVDDNRKRCMVEIESEEVVEELNPKITVAISIIKNSSRFEWFLEKATEIGVNEIIPLICERTEKEKFRHDRMNGILISAMLQSQQSWLPVLHEPTPFNEVVKNSKAEKKFIAHCMAENKAALNQHISTSARQLITIGPEGDFTPKEIDLCLINNFIPVALGNTRLRTETAGIVAATLLRNAHSS